MDREHFCRALLIFSLLFILPLGCAAPARIVTELPPFPDGFMNARWGVSVEEAKNAIQTDGSQWFQDRTAESPYALYASGTYLDRPATFTYFFTPKSKKLFRVDVTFDDPNVYGKVRNDLIQKFKGPSFSQKDVDHWSWKDRSLIILQRDATSVQVSYSSGPFLILNHQEGNGLLR